MNLEKYFAFVIRPDFFNKLIYGRAYPEKLAPPEKLNCHFELYLYFDPQPSILLTKIYNFTRILNENLFLFDRLKLSSSFILFFFRPRNPFNFNSFP